MKQAFFFLSLATVARWVCSTRGPENDSLARDSDMAAAELQKFYKPGEAMEKSIAGLEATDQAGEKSVQNWSQRSYEAVKAAHRVVIESTNKAQNVLMHNAVHLHSAIKGKFHDEMANIDKLDLDDKTRQSIRDLHGGMGRKFEMTMQSIRDGHGERLKGKKVLINSKYNGEDKSIRGETGTVVGWFPGQYKWEVKLDSGKETNPILSVDQFLMLPPDDKEVLAVHGSPSAHEFSGELLADARAEALKPYQGAAAEVRIERLPEEGLPAEVNANQDRYLQAQGQIINYRPTSKQFQVQVAGHEDWNAHDSTGKIWLSKNDFTQLR